MKQDINNRIFEIDKATGTKKTFHYDEQDDTCVIATRQDVTGIIESAREEYKISRGFKGDGFHHAANIPNVILWDLWRRGILMDDDALLKWIDDPDNRAFKTHPGKVRRR